MEQFTSKIKQYSDAPNKHELKLHYAKTDNSTIRVGIFNTPFLMMEGQTLGSIQVFSAAQ